LHYPSTTTSTGLTRCLPIVIAACGFSVSLQLGERRTTFLSQHREQRQHNQGLWIQGMSEWAGSVLSIKRDLNIYIESEAPTNWWLLTSESLERFSLQCEPFCRIHCTLVQNHLFGMNLITSYGVTDGIAISLHGYIPCVNRGPLAQFLFFFSKCSQRCIVPWRWTGCKYQKAHACIAGPCVPLTCHA